MFVFNIKKNLEWLSVSGPEEDAAAAKAAADAAAASKKFTQEEVNSFLAEDRRKHKVQTEKLINDLEQLKTSRGLSEKEKTELTTKIEELNQQVMTKEQLAEKDKKRIEGEYTKQLETEKKEKETWQNRYSESTVKRAITDAAVEYEAFSSEQLVNMLERGVRLVEEVDESNRKTGNYIPRMKFHDTDKDGKPIVLDLTVKEAVKRMRELPEKYGNLFRSSANGGLGGGSSRGTPLPKDISKLTMEQYIEFRKKNPNLDLSKVGR